MKNLIRIALVLLFGLIASFSPRFFLSLSRRSIANRTVSSESTLLSLHSTGSASAQDPSLLLEEGIYTEETLGKLADAIKIYQQILADPKAMPAISAMSLFRLGMCHQKSGRIIEARAAFTRFEKMYPELKDFIPGIPAGSIKKPSLGPEPN